MYKKAFSVLFLLFILIARCDAQDCNTLVEYIKKNYESSSYTEIQSKIENSHCNLSKLSANELKEYYLAVSNFYNFQLDNDNLYKLIKEFYTLKNVDSKTKATIRLDEVAILSDRQQFKEADSILIIVKKYLDFIKMNDSSLCVSYYSKLGSLEGYKLNPYEMAKNYETAINYIDEKHQINKGILFYNLGSLQMAHDLPFEASITLKKAKAFLKKYGKDRIPYVDIALATNYLELDSLDKAYQIINENKNITNKGLEPWYNLLKARYFLVTNQLTSAQQEIEKLYKQQLANGDVNQSELYRIGTLVYLNMNNLIKAKSFLDKYKSLNGDPKEKVLELEFRYKVLQNMGEAEYKKLNTLLTDLEKASRITIAKNIIQKNSQINELERTKVVNKLRAEKIIDVAAISFQRKSLFAFGFTMICIAILAYSLFVQNKKREKANKLLENQKSEIELLNSELNHRVKNNLAFMTSLLEMQGRRESSPQVKDALRESESRLQALSLIHHRLSKSKVEKQINLKNYLQEVVEKLKEVFTVPGQQLQVNTDFEDLFIDVEKAMRIGLIINELFTNSIKHW
jgi:hypothetical protein